MAMMTAGACFPSAYRVTTGAVSPFEVTCVVFDFDLDLSEPGAVALDQEQMAAVLRSEFVRAEAIRDGLDVDTDLRASRFSEYARDFACLVSGYLDSLLPVIVFAHRDALAPGFRYRRRSDEQWHDPEAGHCVLVVGRMGKPWLPERFCYHDPFERPYITTTQDALAQAAYLAPRPATGSSGGRTAEPCQQLRLLALTPKGVGLPLSAAIYRSSVERLWRTQGPRQPSTLWVPPVEAVSSWRLAHTARLQEHLARCGMSPEHEQLATAHCSGAGEWVWIQEWQEHADVPADRAPVAVWVTYAGEDPKLQAQPLLAACEPEGLFLSIAGEVNWLGVKST